MRNEIGEERMEDEQLEVAPFCKEAVFSDGTILYRNPQEANLFDIVKIRIRVSHNNLDEVWLRNKNQKLGMNLWLTKGLFDYFEVALEIKEEQESYYFELVKGDRTYYYNTNGVTEDTAPEKAFTILAGYKTPDWAKGAVFYQIFVDRFYNGDVSNDVLDNEYHYIGESVAQVLDWNKYPAVNGVREFLRWRFGWCNKKIRLLRGSRD